MAKKELRLLIAGIIVLITGCQPAHTTTPTPIIVPTKNPAITETLWPTITAALTATPIPATPTVPPHDLLNEYFDHVTIKSIDQFENLKLWQIWDEESVSLNEGEVTLVGRPNWNSALVYNIPISENQGIMLTYKALNQLDSKAEFVFISGTYQTDDFRQFGIYNGPAPKADLYQGKVGLGFNYLHGNYTIRKDTWQTLIMSVDDQGNFLAIIFNPEDPEQRYVYSEKPGEKWKGHDWEFRITVTDPETIVINRFQKFEFSGSQN